MTAPSKLGKALTVVFVAALVALLAEFLYVLWRRRVRRNDQPDSGRDHDHDHHSGLTSNPSSSSKELLYFFCLKTQSRVEPQLHGSEGSEGSSVDDPVEIIDVFKLREMYGPSRVLFTIKEEEKEDLESERSLSSTKKTRNLSECFEDTRVSPEIVVTIDEEGTEVTPFSTPCASPSYFTPLASPVHEMERRACADETAW